MTPKFHPAYSRYGCYGNSKLRSYLSKKCALNSKLANAFYILIRKSCTMMAFASSATSRVLNSVGVSGFCTHIVIIIFTRSNKKMIRSYASRIIASVKHAQSGLKVSERETVRNVGYVSLFWWGTKPDLTVSFPISRASPNPAIIQTGIFRLVWNWSVNVYSTPESFFLPRPSALWSFFSDYWKRFGKAFGSDVRIHSMNFVSGCRSLMAGGNCALIIHLTQRRAM